MLKAKCAEYHSDQAADAPGRGWTFHILGKFTLWDRDARSFGVGMIVVLANRSVSLRNLKVDVEL